MDDDRAHDLIRAGHEARLDSRQWQYVLKRLKKAGTRAQDVLVSLSRRSLDLHDKLQMARTQASILRNSLDALNSAIVLLRHNGRVVFLNTTAERLIGRCSELCIKRNRLCATRHADSLKLEQLTKQATGKEGRRPLGGAMTMQCGFARQPLQVAAVPVPLDNQAKLTTGLGSLAMLVIHDPSEQTYLRDDILAEMFGLTPTEARLLLALGRGQTLKQYGDESHVTQNTARTHLKSVFAKTETSRQSELVRLIGGITHSVRILMLYGTIYIAATWDFLNDSFLCGVAICT